VRAAARGALAAYGPEAAGALVDGLRGANESVRAGSLELLGALAAGANFGFDPKIDPSAQQEALAKWGDWLAALDTTAAR
jgi:hypothetical protein